MKDIIQYVEENRERFVQELISWLKIPSISTLSENREDVFAAGKWAENKLKEIGFPKVDLIEGEGHPLVFAEWCAHSHQPTLLIYGHYDVQPVDPLHEWRSDPFSPRVEDGNIYGRGTTDDKGQLMLVLAALEAWSRVEGQLPINVKVLIEGEEEAGGESVAVFVRENVAKLGCDCALICDTHMNSRENPSLILGLRGIVYTEITVKGARSDLHSGSYGGVAPNPIHALCLLISRLKGEGGKINIPSLYSPVADVSREERSFWQENREDLEQRLFREMGVDELFGENEIPPHERLGVRPTLEVHGMRGGFTGEGAKTVIPAEATAKISLRLPAGMSSGQIFADFETAVKGNMPGGYLVQVTHIHGGEGVSVSAENTCIQAASAALHASYGIEPVYMREGGSIPIAALFDTILNVPVVLMGFGLPDDGAHGPNEKFSLDQFFKGMTTVADYFGRLRVVADD